MTKLDPESVMTIKKLHARGVPRTAIARMLGWVQPAMVAKERRRG